MLKQAVIVHLILGFICSLVGGLSYAAYGNLTQDIVLYNLPKGTQFATVIALSYMINIVGSVAICI